MIPMVVNSSRLNSLILDNDVAVGSSKNTNKKNMVEILTRMQAFHNGGGINNVSQAQLAHEARMKRPDWHLLLGVHRS